MVKTENDKQTTILHETQHRKLKTEQHEIQGVI